MKEFWDLDVRNHLPLCGDAAPAPIEQKHYQK